MSRWKTRSSCYIQLKGGGGAVPSGAMSSPTGLRARRTEIPRSRTAVPGTGGDPEIVDTMAKRLDLKQSAPSDRRGSTANTARISPSSKQRRHPPNSDPHATSEQACPHQDIAAKSERQRMFRHRAMAVPATKTCVTGTYRTKSREQRGVPPKLIIFNGFLVGARAPHCQGQICQRDRFATTVTIPTRNGDFGATRAGSEWPARRAHSTACPNA